MSRKRKLMLNTATGILKQLVAVACGFVLPRFMLLYYGSDVNGLISSITHFLSFITLLEMGVGPVIMANLYGSLASKDINQISLIVKSSERFFRTLACIFLGYIAVLAVLFPTVINSGFTAVFSVSLLFIIAISTFAQYFFGITYQLLLNADQRAYIPLTLSIVTIALNTVCSIVMIKCGASVHMVKLMTATLYLARPLGQTLYVRKHFALNRKIELVGEPIKQKWNGFSQHLAAVVCKNVDVVVLSVLSTMENVSVYSVYYLITDGIEQMVLTGATGIDSLFGNMIAKNETNTLKATFSAVEWAVHFIVTVVFTITGIMLIPFVSIYTRGVTDADYIVPLFGCLMVSAYASQCLRAPYFRLIKAAGHFKQTQNGAYVSAGINIVVTVGLVFKFGLVGAAIGTLAAMLYHTCYFVHYLKNNIVCRSPKYFYLYLLTDCVISGISVFICSFYPISDKNYLMWALWAVVVSITTLAVAGLVNIIFYRGRIKTLISLLKKDEKTELSRA